MIDDIQFPDNWQPRWARYQAGKVIIGNTGAEGAVLSAVLSGLPVPQAPPYARSQIPALETKVDKTKIDILLATYQTIDSPSVSLSQLKKNLLSLLEDVLFYELTQAFIKDFKARSAQAPKIWEYVFDEANPFEGAFKGIPSQALDLAYLHGDLDIFDGTVHENGNRSVQSEMQS